MSISAQDKIVTDFEKKLFGSALGRDHAYRKLNRLINFDEVAVDLQKTYSHLGQPGIPAVRGLKAMLLQFWEDYSDREMEAAVRENLAIRWFVGFSLTEKTPDHSYFGKFRKRIGTQHLADIFNSINERLQREGLFGNIFYFIDASTIITKSALWEERDRTIKDGHDKLNNLIVKDYAVDKEARWGAKSKKNIWFGYKRHTAVDMRYGLITKTTVTPANVLDYQVVEQICPKQKDVSLWINCLIRGELTERLKPVVVLREQSEKTTIQPKTTILTGGDLRCGCLTRVRSQNYQREPDTEEKQK